MKPKAYDRNRAEELLPLLSAITREIEEREASIGRLDEMIRALSISPKVHGDEIANLQAESAIEKRELRYALEELEDLGCEVDSSLPLTIRIPGLSGDTQRGFAWRPGDESLRLHSADHAA